MGEFIHSCAERELWEEVGIKAKFRSLLYFRELPITKNKIMDIYFACLMDFQEGELQNIKVCEREISEFQFVPLKECKEFGEKHCSGTQKEVTRYIHDLNEQGLDFKKGRTPFSAGYDYISPRDHL